MQNNVMKEIQKNWCNATIKSESNLIWYIFNKCNPRYQHK